MLASPILRSLCGFLLLAVSALAQQTLTISPYQLNVNFQRNTLAGTATSRSLDVTNVTSRVAVSTAVDAPNNVNWLFVNVNLLEANQGATRRVDVTILTSGLAPGNYTGRVIFAPEGGTAINVPVALLVSDLRTQNANPATLTFVVQRNGARPPTQPLNVTATTGTLSVTSSATSSPTPWILLEQGPINTPNSFNVTVLPGDLAIGDYNGTIVLTAAGNAGETIGNPTLNVPVRLRVVDDSKLSVSPATLSYDFQLGGATPAARTVSIGSTGSPLAYTAEVATPGTSVQWLTVTPVTGNTPQSLTVNLQNLPNLPAGTFTGNITIKTAAGDSQTVTVTLRVSVDPLMTVTPSQLIFTFQQGGSQPPRQTVIVSNNGNPTNFTASVLGVASQWLTVTPASATTPAALVIGVNTANLSPGVLDGVVEIRGNFGNSPFQIPVRLVVSGNSQPLLRLSQNQLNFAFQTGNTATLSQVVTVSSTSVAVNFTPSVTLGGSWLTVSPATNQNATADITVSVTPGSLGPGLYTGQISILTSQIPNSIPVTIPVQMVISTQPLLSVTPSALAFTLSGATSPQRQTIRVNSTGNNFAYQSSASVAGGGTWLLSAQSGPNTGSTIEVGVNPIVAEGAGLITITAPGIENSPVFVPVTLSNTGSTSQLTIAPNQLDFVQVVGATAVPAQTLDISLGQGGGLTSYRIGDIRYLNGANWLKVSKTAGIAPDKIEVSVDTAALSPGRYAATIPFESTVGNRDVVVFLEVRRITSTFNVNQESLTFNFAAGGQAPASQQIQVSSSGDAIPFTAEARVNTGTLPWLQVQSSGSATPATLTVSVNTANLAPGAYQGTISLTSPVAGVAARTINVTLNVAAAVTPVLGRMVNAASFLDAGAVPGMIVSLLGTNLGPTVGVAAAPNAAGIYDRQLSNVKVLFDTFEAPILFISATQINAVVPYLVAPRLTTRVVVEVNGVRSNGLDLRVATAAPGIFLVSAAGQGAILNQDNTLNGAANPAARDSIISIYATGEGQTNPPGVDGAIPGRSTPLKQPSQRVRVRIGGQEAEVLYAGSAPLAVSGLMQVNAKIPAGVSPGSAVQIEVLVGDTVSASGVTVAIR